MSEADTLKQQSDAKPSDVAAAELATDALFEDERYTEAKEIAQRTLKIHGISDSSRKELERLIRKCDTHIPASSTTHVDAAKAVASAEVPKAKQQQPAVRNEWFQTPNTVTFSYFVKNRTKDDVRVDTSERSYEVAIKFDVEGHEFQQCYEPLFGAIDPSKTAVVVKSMKIEVTIHKVAPAQWPALELAEGAQPAKDTTAHYPSTQQQLKYPNSRGKDWNKFKVEDEEGDAKPSGDEALSKLFKDIYSKGDEDQRRAMMKSYQESGGTVLSTNWKDVGSKEVKGEAPKGMEMRKWKDDGI